MSEDKFNPITASRIIEDSYRGYIESTIHFSDAALQKQLNTLLKTPGYLSKGPYLEAAPPYLGKASTRELVNEGILSERMMELGGGNLEAFDPDRKLYDHQVRAIKLAQTGENIIITTGTGSGKTECFLLPILNDILREFEQTGPQPGVRAMILYPMNALANDQLKRLRGLLSNAPITFGRYTGDTPNSQAEAEEAWAKENPGKHRAENELISRQVMRNTPPNILITNYSMLEYLLLRPEDSAFFSGAFGATWRHIAIDEAHIYSGALGTEIAYLLRRLKARIAANADSVPQVQCYATSATIGSKSTEDLERISRFAEDLFGERFHDKDNLPNVIAGAQDDPTKDLRPIWGELPVSRWETIQKCLDSESANIEDLCDLLEDCVPTEELNLLQNSKTLELGLGKLLLGERTTNRLVIEASEQLIDLTPYQNSNINTDQWIRELDPQLLSSMVEVLSKAQRRPSVPIMSSRYHFFLRGPEGLFVNLHTDQIGPDKRVSEMVDGIDGLVPVYELAACRHCGEAYLLGREESSIEEDLTYLDPKPVGEDPSEPERLDPRQYYRLLHDPEDVAADETVYWICPTCGSLHDSPNGGKHRFAHELVERIPIAKGSANEENSQCPHCDYSNVNAIQPMRVSPEAVGSVVCYDLVRLVPHFDPPKDEAPAKPASRFRKSVLAQSGNTAAGSVICFSDRRQDAAYFAPAMERTYNSTTIRQLIRTAVSELSENGNGVLPSRVCKWIASEGAKRYKLLLRGSDKESVATAWVIGELMTDTPRNSLEGLGVIRVEPAQILQAFKEEEIRDAVQGDIARMDPNTQGWLTAEDYFLFVRQCIDSIRKNGGIKVPFGVDDRLNERTRTKPKYVCKCAPSSKTDRISFIGKTGGPENGRSSFIRKYALSKYKIKATRENAAELLSYIYSFIVDLCGGFIYEDEPDLFKTEPDGSFRFGMDAWLLYPKADSDKVWICDTCGCEWHWDHHGVCPTHRCSGHLVEKTFNSAFDKDAHYKKAYQEQPLPLRIEEHTAQLSTERARDVQSAFIHGDVNVLSCTTTFELGVDVGDLRCVFMRNVPPRTANYTQRAGRVGRRAGKPGFAVTFARLRSHDLAQFKNPERMISGVNPVPSCYLNNEAIALRHVFAVALSEYFRKSREAGEDYSHLYNEFLDLSKPNPQGIDDLRAWLDGHPESIEKQLNNVFLDCAAGDALEINTWGWIEKLVGPDGRLIHAHQLKHEDYERLNGAIQQLQASGETFKAAGLLRRRGGLEQQRTINVLAENGILPKYGFPTDLVELNIPSQDQSLDTNPLRLQRGLRQAIREYAPGNEIIADKRVWKSTGIRRIKERPLEVRRYGFCPNCGAFAWPIDNEKDTAVCKACHAEVKLTSRMLIPSEGFTATLVERDAGAQQPKRAGTLRIEFCQSWEGEKQEEMLSYPGGLAYISYATNGRLCAMNANGRAGYQFCSYCGAAAPGFEELRHEPWCEHPFTTRYQALGASFTSDVLEFGFSLLERHSAKKEDWESLAWALYTAAANLLEIPSNEIGATFYPNDMGSYSVMIYDDVPGGAGHALQLAEHADEVLRSAYDLVANCSCGEDTCCYGCLCNYYNQGRQAKLSRGAALNILRSLLISPNGE